VSSAKRAAAMPELPTIAEATGTNYEFSSWFGLFAPAGTPREIVARLSSEAAAIVSMPDIRERLPAMGNEPVGSASEEFSAKYHADIAQYARVVNAAGIPPAD
jgi:tripartite-type tricarboxylate transporter receptor subunit TctC